MHGIPVEYVTVDIIQAANRLLPTMSESVSTAAMHRLDKLGINIILGRAVTGEDANGVFLKDIKFNSKTIIWTAGVKPSHIYATIAGLAFDKGGHILVDEHMRVGGFEGVFALGDSASTKFAGTAQTAIYDGRYIAHVIGHEIHGQGMPEHTPRNTPYVVPIGENWAIFTYKNITLTGWPFWILRQFIDFKFFLSILPFKKAFTVWRQGGVLCESCPTCLEAEAANNEYPA
jgi:NADH dehydrogenase